MKTLQNILKKIKHINKSVLVLSIVILLGILFILSKGDNDKFFTNPGFMKSLNDINSKLKSISSSNIIKFKGNETEMIPQTTDLQTTLDLDEITKRILEKINCKEYTFVKTNYDRVKKIEKKDKINYIYEVFLGQLNGVNISLYKMKANVIIYITPEKKRDYVTATEYTNSPFTEYPIGIPSPDQLVPLATEVIPTGNEVLGTKTVNPIMKHQINKMHINYVTIYNSTMVLHPDKATRQTGGYNESTLESSVVEGMANSNPKLRKSIYRNVWPDINPSKKFNWPCTPIKFQWNSLGVNTSPNKSTNSCPGYTYNTNYQIDKPAEQAFQYWANNIMTPSNIRSGPNYWLFDLTRGLPSFPIGQGS